MLRSECGELLALFRPVRRDTCLDQIVAGEARGLLTFHYCLQKLRRQRRQIDDILNPAFRRPLGLGNLGECFAFYDHHEPAPGLDDVPDQSLVDFRRCIPQVEFQFHTATSHSERRVNNRHPRPARFAPVGPEQAFVLNSDPFANPPTVAVNARSLRPRA